MNKLNLKNCTLELLTVGLAATRNLLLTISISFSCKLSFNLINLRCSLYISFNKRDHIGWDTKVNYSQPLLSKCTEQSTNKTGIECKYHAIFEWMVQLYWKKTKQNKNLFNLCLCMSHFCKVSSFMIFWISECNSMVILHSKW